MKISKLLLAGMLLAGSAFAQDPGNQDSIIVETIDVGWSDSASLRIYVKTDDSVGYYNIPLTFTLIEGEPGFYFLNVRYFSILLQWDLVRDTVVLENRYIHMYAQNDTGGEPNPPLYTGYYDFRIFSLNFVFDLLNWSFIEIDTTNNPAYGSLLFRLTDGITEFTPAFIKGYLSRGIIVDNYPDNEQLPSRFILKQNYPNPFNASTTIKFDLAQEAEVNLSVYNILGQKVAVICDEIKRAGVHRVIWDVAEYPSGMYFGRLETGGISKSVKMVLLK